MSLCIITRHFITREEEFKNSRTCSCVKIPCPIALSHNFSQLEAWNGAVKFLHVWYLKGEE